MAGRPPAEKSFKAALDKAIKQDPKALRRAADKLLSLAADGEPWAVKELADRLDGKPAQSTEISGPGGKPIQAKVTLEFIGKAPAGV